MAAASAQIAGYLRVAAYAIALLEYVHIWRLCTSEIGLIQL